MTTQRSTARRCENESRPEYDKLKPFKERVADDIRDS
jgi:hypothetical protein